MSRAWPVQWSEQDHRDLDRYMFEGKSHAQIAAIFTQHSGRTITKEAVRSAARRWRLKDRPSNLVHSIIVEMTTPISERSKVYGRLDWEDTREGHDLWSMRVNDINDAWKFIALDPVMFTVKTAYEVTDDCSNGDWSVEVSAVEFDPRDPQRLPLLRPLQPLHRHP